MDFYISVVLIGISALFTVAVSLPVFKVLQLSGYKAKGVLSWWKATGYDLLIRYIALMLFAFIAMIVFVGCFGSFEYVAYCADALYILMCGVFLFSTVKCHSGNAKFTGRMVRLIVVDAVITLVLAAGVAWATYASAYCQTVVSALAGLAPFTAMASCAITSPFEKLHNKKYIRLAKSKLDGRTTVIGITGSYGKTTAKNILAAMLATQADVLATPASYNTPMGVCRTVNDSLGGQRYFIAEMGARNRGDIKELCDIVAPRYGIITAVGDMHLESFGSRSVIADTKYELAEALPADGLLVLNGYNRPCAELASRTAPCKVVCVGEGISVTDIVIDAHGTSFTLNISGTAYPVTTALCGAHIPQLVCTCAAVAVECGITPENIVAAVKALRPVEHRLQIIENGPVTVIDDAYNSNPVGAKNALDVLSRFDGKKIIITPGFVELGSLEKPCNIELGKNIAAVCDRALLVGSRAADIKRGATDAGMNEADISVFASRDEAVKALGDTSGCVVLFENDLPDNIK